jgi:hypothetical protein
MLRLNVLDALVELQLDLSDGLETAEEIIVEDSKVGEWLGFPCGSFLL